jgi:hypothetical protein
MIRVCSAVVGILIAAGTLDVAAQANLDRAKTSGAKPAVSRPVSARATRSVSPYRGTGPNVSTTIQGNALNSTNGALPNTVVRLRDVRFGRIAEVATTDRAGLFEFHAEPGSYVVELVGNDGTILATSQILSIEAGQAVSTVVKLPFRAAPFGGVFGHTAASAAAVASAAAASGLLAIKVNGCVSPPCQ